MADNWEKIIAIAVLVFTIYPLAKDFVDENPNFGHTLIAYFLATGIAILFLWIASILQPHGTTNITQTQGNVTHEARIKACLDLLKIVISALIVVILGLGAYSLQSLKPNSSIVMVAMLVFFVPLLFAIFFYCRLADRLE